MISLVGLSACEKKVNETAMSKLERFGTIKLGKKSYTIEFARTAAEQQHGLSDRDEIGQDGMLFIFDQPKIPAFWMKDMHFDLDFIWIRSGKISEIMSDVKKPESLTENLPVYRPQEAADMMLEVNAGFAKKEGLKVGDEAVVSY